MKDISIRVTLTLILNVAGGYVLYNLWQWYLVPLGIVDISLIQSIGIRLIFGFLTDKIPRKQEEAIDKIYAVSYSISSYILVLAFGYFWKMFL